MWSIKFVSPLTTRISVISSSPARRPWCSNSPSKRAWVSFISAEIALKKIFFDEDSADGMDSREERDLDRQIAHVVLKCEVVRLR